MVVVSTLVGVVVVGAAALAVRKATSTTADESASDEFMVQRGSFEITIPTSGELAALNQVEIRNRLEHRAVLTWVIDEGKTVTTGDVLFRLADEDIRNKIKDAEDKVNNATAALIAAQSNLDIRLSSTQSEQAKSDLKVTLAELALEAWEEGEVVSRRQQLALDLETAQKNYDRLVDRYEESRKLVGQEFLSMDEFRRDEIAMIEARARLEQVKLDARVYENYEYKQERAQKESDVEQAVAERERVKERHKAELETVRSEVASKQHNLESSQERLAKLQEQLALCTVGAPSDGWVVYASSLEGGRMSWRNNGQPPTVGTELRRNDLVIILPDTTKMIANVKVNEALSGLVEAGQSAVVTSDAMPDEVLEGEVLSVGVLAESGGWIDRNRRDYTVKILLTDGNDMGLKPSMRCKAEIYVGQVEDALYVPLQAVFREGPTAYVYVPQGSGFAQQKVTLGRASELHVEVTDGLSGDDVVLLREPPPQEIVARLESKQPNAEPRPEGPVNERVWARRGQEPRRRQGEAKESSKGS
jgi:multidrug resistance efflux pump